MSQLIAAAAMKISFLAKAEKPHIFARSTRTLTGQRSPRTSSRLRATIFVPNKQAILAHLSFLSAKLAAVTAASTI
jgi:hypothetical protein